jgi:hypothetical protein
MNLHNLSVRSIDVEILVWESHRGKGDWFFKNSKLGDQDQDSKLVLVLVCSLNLTIEILVLLQFWHK